MKIIITEEQFYNLIPNSVKRRMTNKDFQILYDIIDNNRRYYVAQDFDRYLEGNLQDSLNEFIREYKVEEIDPNLNNDAWDDEENIRYKIFWQLIPFLKKKYYNELYDYHTEYHRRRGSMNESQDERLFGKLPNFLKRRLTQDDLEYLDKELTHYILSTPPLDKFESFSRMVVGDLLHEFIMDKKSDEIETEEDPDYGEVYNEESRNKVMNIYWELKPILEKRYKDRLYQSWERKKSIGL